MSRPQLVFVFTTAILVVAAAALAHGPAALRIHELDHAIARDGARVDLLVERAALYDETGDLAAALADYDRALSIDDNRADVYCGRARVLLELREFDAALDCVDRSIEREPDRAGGWRVRARALCGLGRTRDAVAAFDRVIALARPPLPDDYLERADVLAALGAGGVAAALASLDAGVARLGHAVALELRAVELERRRGDFDAALARVDDLRGGYDRVEVVLSLRGDVLSEAGRRLEADAAYTDALQAIDARCTNGQATPSDVRLREELLRKLGREAPR